MKLLLAILAWLKGLFSTPIKYTSPTVWEELTRKQRAMSNTKWLKLIHKLKSKNGQGTGFRSFGTFSKCTPFRCNHKDFR